MQVQVVIMVADDGAIRIVSDRAGIDLFVARSGQSQCTDGDVAIRTSDGRSWMVSEPTSSIDPRAVHEIVRAYDRVGHVMDASAHSPP